MEKKHQYLGLTKQEVEESRRLHGENPIGGMVLIHDYRRRTLLGTGG